MIAIWLPSWDWFVNGLKTGDWRAWLVIGFAALVLMTVVMLKKK